MNALVPIMVLYGMVAAAGFYFAEKERKAHGAASDRAAAKAWPAFPPAREIREADPRR